LQALVTGAGGFLGSAIVRQLGRTGDSVRCMLKRTERVNATTGMSREVVEADLLEPASLRQAIMGIDVVFHCAAVLPGRGDDAQMLAVNVLGTRNLLEASCEAGVSRFVLASTDSVYGGRACVGACEHTPVDLDYFPEGIYPRTKYDAERFVLEAHRAQRIDAVILRPCLMYGPGVSAGNEILKRWARKRVRLLLDRGMARLSLGYVDDVAAAFVLAAKTARASGQIFNVSDGAIYSRREILETVADFVGRRPAVISMPSFLLTCVGTLLLPIVRRIAPAAASLVDPERFRFAASDHVIDCSKAMRELGYAPTTRLREGLAQVSGL
jgi:nucleoside-diphosphate-sugar epimerase